MELNKLMWAARLVQEPTLRFATNGTAVCTIRVAANRSAFDKSAGPRGAKKEEATFLNWVFFAEHAESAAKFLHKGTAVLLEGWLKQSDWTDKEGRKRSDYEAVGTRWQFAESKPKVEADGVSVEQDAAPPAADGDGLPF